MFEKGVRAMRLIFSSLGLIIFGFALGTMVAPGLADDTPQINNDLLTETGRIYASLYQQVSPSVVSITVASGTGTDQFGRSGGSGFVVDKQGHIVTNFHVVDDAQQIEINFFDGTITEATVVGLDPDSDLAVVKVNLSPDRLIPLPFADSDRLTVGQHVLALGNPHFQDWTLTSGIISALNRSISGLNNYSIGGVIQTDAAINHGNSGGPLINLRGELIGVNSQIIPQSNGIGFAIPSNLVRRVMNDLITLGEVQYSFIGINSLPVSLDFIRTFNLPDNLQGVLVRQVLPNTPASAAGLRSMSQNDRTVDVITAINGVPIDNFDQMIGYLSINTRPGETVTFTVYRGGQYLNIPLVLDVRP